MHGCRSTQPLPQNPECAYQSRPFGLKNTMLLHTGCESIQALVTLQQHGLQPSLQIPMSDWTKRNQFNDGALSVAWRCVTLLIVPHDRMPCLLIEPIVYGRKMHRHLTLTSPLRKLGSNRSSKLSQMASKSVRAGVCARAERRQQENRHAFGFSILPNLPALRMSVATGTAALVAWSADGKGEAMEVCHCCV